MPQSEPSYQALEAREGGIGAIDAQAEKAFARLVVYAILPLFQYVSFLWAWCPKHLSG